MWSYPYVEPTVAVKLFVDKENQKVLFAECDKDFVDVLFSFLTMPLGTIVRILGNQSGVGCLDQLYGSVGSLSIDHFQTEACKTMLLRPLNAAANQCDRLKVRVDDTNPREIYLCSNTECQAATFSSVRDVVCIHKPKPYGCSGRHSRRMELPENDNAVIGCADGGGFVQSGLKFIITDDLQVSPASTGLVFSMLDKFGLSEKANVEEVVLHLNCSKITNLLKRTLISKQPFTGLYFNIHITPDNVNQVELPEMLSPKLENNGAANMFSAIRIKLIQTEDSSAVLYAEVGPDFIDLIFGLLSIPLGSVIKAYSQWPQNGCFDNLYRSIDGSAKGCIRDGCRSLLLSPKLACFFRCSINALQVEESGPKTLSHRRCSKCSKNIWGGNKCPCPNVQSYPKFSYSVTSVDQKEMNPKSTKQHDSYTRAYIKGGPRNFIVTNDLRILHFSLANTLQVMRASNIPKEKLVEKELSLDRTQVLTLLRAAIATREALSSVLLPLEKKRHPHN